MRHLEFSTVCYEREGRGPESPDAATLITEGWLTSWAHWVQERCFESGAQSQCPSFLLLLWGLFGGQLGSLGYRIEPTESSTRPSTGAV